MPRKLSVTVSEIIKIRIVVFWMTNIKSIGIFWPIFTKLLFPYRLNPWILTKKRLRKSLEKLYRLNEEFKDVKLEDLKTIATLGIGGFGRVELVQLQNDSTRSFALKKMRKQQILATKQQQHILSEKDIMLEANCDFIVKLYR